MASTTLGTWKSSFTTEEIAEEFARETASAPTETLLQQEGLNIRDTTTPDGMRFPAEARVAQSDSYLNLRGNMDAEATAEAILDVSDKSLDDALKIQQAVVPYRQGNPDFSEQTYSTVQPAYLDGSRGDMLRADKAFALDQATLGDSQFIKEDGTPDTNAVRAHIGGELDAQWHHEPDQVSESAVDRAVHQFYSHTGAASELRQEAQANRVTEASLEVESPPTAAVLETSTDVGHELPIENTMAAETPVGNLEAMDTSNTEEHKIPVLYDAYDAIEPNRITDAIDTSATEPAAATAPYETLIETNEQVEVYEPVDVYQSPVENIYQPAAIEPVFASSEAQPVDNAVYDPTPLTEYNNSYNPGAYDATYDGEYLDTTESSSHQWDNFYDEM